MASKYSPMMESSEITKWSFSLFTLSWARNLSKQHELIGFPITLQSCHITGNRRGEVISSLLAKKKKCKTSAKFWLHLIYSPRLFFIKYVWLLSLIKWRINFGKLTTDAVYVQFYQTDLFISCQLLERLHFGAVLNC